VCPRAVALDLWDLDFSAGAGFLTGSVKNGNGSYGYAGFPVDLEYHLDLTRSLSAGADLSFVLDPVNLQITRTGFEFTGAYHLLGGSRRIVHSYGDIEIAASDPYDLSLGVRIGFQHYSASTTDPTTGNAVTAIGSVFETLVGLQFRQDLSPRSSIEVEVYTTALSLSASVELLTSSYVITLLSWRFFL
jgi:hypothetical protein